MKYLFIILSKLLILVDSGGVNEIKIFPNLPLGEYRVIVKAVIHCSENKNSKLQFNVYLYKTSRTTTELRGNVSIIDKAFDDNLSWRMSMDVKDKIGRWQNNAYVYQTPKAYTNAKKIFGPEFLVFLNCIGANKSLITNEVLPGMYLFTKGYDVSNYPSNTNFPKQIFYGTYKFNIIITDKQGEQYGCIQFICEIKRPWETD